MAITLLLVLVTGQFIPLWLGLIGWFIFKNALVYEKKNQLEDILLQTTVGEVMGWDLRVVDARLTLLEFTEKYLLDDRAGDLDYFAASEGRYRGQVRVADLHGILRGEWESLTLADIAHPLTEIPAVHETTLLYQAIMTLEAQADVRLTVLSPADAVAGTVDRGDIVKAIASKLQWTIPPQELQRIKTEGHYPTYLQLSSLAKSLQNELP
jgi:CBS domain-containing protein